MLGEVLFFKQQNFLFTSTMGAFIDPYNSENNLPILTRKRKISYFLNMGTKL
jgi:hypothetical protein